MSVWGSPRGCLSVALVTLVVAALVACTEIECRDADGDGYGVGCPAGPDCDDDDPGRVNSCDVAPSDCDAQPQARGCPCLGGGTRACYPGPEGTADVGRCLAGRHFCNQGSWTLCEGAVLPGREVCNEADDDCDGRTDERVISPCGGCDPTCVGGVWGEGGAPFSGTAPLSLTESGRLTLARNDRARMVVWVANTDEGTVSKLDARAALEVARYRVGPASAGLAPGRIAVDYLGDAWVLSTAADETAELTKLAADSDRCAGPGEEPVTSQGPSDVLPWGEDACVLLHMRVGAPGEGPGSLAVDGTREQDGFDAGHPWVGLQSGQLVQIHGERGEVLRSLDLPGVVPHAAVFDRGGAQWVLDRGGRVVRVSPAGDALSTTTFESHLDCYTLEALAGGAGGELLMTGFACENVVAFDPDSGTWRHVETQGVLSTRGIAVASEAAWVVHTAGALSRVEQRPLSIASTHSLAFDVFAPVDSAGVAVDGEEQLWVVSRLGGPDGRGVATRFDPVSAVPTAEVAVGLGPRSAGDFTGNALAGSFEPEGSERHVFAGCAGQGLDAGVFASPVATAWRRLHLSAFAGGEAGSVEVAIRHGQDAGALAAAAFSQLASLPADTSPFELDLPDGGLVEVELRLVAGHHIGAPRVAQVGLEWECPGPM